MSQQTYERYDRDYQNENQPGMISVATNWIGALLSIGLVIGLAFWGYKLTMRDVSEVPVVRALEGPMRVQPDDPGGTAAAHQGLAVNQVQSTGGVEKPSDRVILAPDPVSLTSEDMDVQTTHPKPRDTKTATETPQAIHLTDVIASDDQADDELDAASAIEAAVNEVAADSELADLAHLPGVKRSPRPKARITVASVARSTVLDDSTPTGDTLTVGEIDIDPSEVEEGARLVQLGAFDDRDAAIREWGHIVDRHGDLIGARKRLIQQAESGGRSFFRLRMVGFDDLGESRRLCSALLARGTPCIPVTAR